MLDIRRGAFDSYRANERPMPYIEFRSARSERPQPLFFVGGFTLTMLAGAINVAMLSYYAVPVSHMSGAVSRLSMDLGTQRYADLATIAFIVGGFALGCVFTGALVSTSALVARRRYALVLACEAAVLALAAVLQGNAANVSVILGAAACGIQNAMASSYYGLVVRTTHVTGIITDLGFMLGACLTGQRFVWWKVLLLVMLVAGYLAGGIAAAILTPLAPELMLWCCCVFAAAIAIGCLFLHRE
jgi:uncharacterized membrane protein YoaK (UPF0700 family)